MENEILYNDLFEVSEEALSDDFVLPLDKAHIIREGTDVTITCMSRMCNVALQVCLCCYRCAAQTSACIACGFSISVLCAKYIE